MHQHPQLIHKFGGHAMAAGLTLAKENFSHFSRLFNEKVTEKLGPLENYSILLSDGELTAEELSLHTGELLREAGPWGQAFPEPLFDGVFEVVHQRVVGTRHLKLQLAKQEQIYDAIAFYIDINQCLITVVNK